MKEKKIKLFDQMFTKSVNNAVWSQFPILVDYPFSWQICIPKKSGLTQNITFSNYDCLGKGQALLERLVTQ